MSAQKEMLIEAIKEKRRKIRYELFDCFELNQWHILRGKWIAYGEDIKLIEGILS